MKLKALLSILSFIQLLGFMSCLSDDNTDTSGVAGSDAQIYSFSMSTDSVPVLAGVSFTIDHLNGLIYNIDSLPYGTKLTKALCSVTTNAAAGIMMIPGATGDTINWIPSDSVNFTQPVKLIVYSRDGINKKTYTAQLNIHRQEGGRISWTQLTDKALNRPVSFQKTILFNGIYYTFAEINGSFVLYSSASGSTWTEQTLSGFPFDADLSSMVIYKGAVYLAGTSGVVYQSVNAGRWTEVSSSAPVKTFIGSIPETKTSPSLLCALISIDETCYFGVTSDVSTWQTSRDAIPANFPVSGFGAASDYNPAAAYAGLIAAGGKNAQGTVLNTTWRTSDGLNWVQLADEKATNFAGKEGAVVIYYVDKYYLIGGKDDSGTYTDDMYVSVTGGVTWQKADTLNAITDLYSPRAYASACVNADNKIMLFGGTNGGTTWIDDVWSGFLNKLGFK
jgi:hypothetical protein